MSAITVPFNKVTITGDEIAFLQEALLNDKFCGDGVFNQKCEYFLKSYSGSSVVHLTPSCTAALEMAMLVCDIKHGDEVILPSYTFSSTANAILIAGATPVFIDCKPNDFNIDETLIESAVTPKTKAILPMHYAGACCEMDPIMDLAEKHGLYVIADAAQAMLSKYKKKKVESLGHISALSFHETKNISCGEGGAIFINDESLIARSEIIREKGTNRKQFLDGLVDKYTWHEIGSSYLMNEFTAAVLYAQLKKSNEMTQQRLEIWSRYHEKLTELEQLGHLRLPHYANDVQHNAHIYYVVFNTIEVRKNVQSALREKGIQAVTHYVPLHNSPAGLKYGKVGSKMDVTENLTDQMLRLPLYPSLSMSDQEKITQIIMKSFC